MYPKTRRRNNLITYAIFSGVLAAIIISVVSAYVFYLHHKHQRTLSLSELERMQASDFLALARRGKRSRLKEVNTRLVDYLSEGTKIGPAPKPFEVCIEDYAIRDTSVPLVNIAIQCARWVNELPDRTGIDNKSHLTPREEERLEAVRAAKKERMKARFKRIIDWFSLSSDKDTDEESAPESP